MWKCLSPAFNQRITICGFPITIIDTQLHQPDREEIMKAILLKKTGKPEVLKYSDVPEPEVGPGKVRVKLEYIGVNYAEILSRKGLYGWRRKGKAYTPGMEGAGIIEAVGQSVDASLIGKPVMVGTQYGCYAEKVVVPAEQALPAIEGYTMQENAAFLVNYLTAWIAMFDLMKTKPEETALITAAAGGVGTAAVQLCSAYGNKVIGLAGSDQKLELIKQLGAAKAINYRTQDYGKIIEEEGGVDVVLEMVGGQIFKTNVKLTRPFGRLAVIGFASFNLKKWNPFSWYRTYRDMPRVDIATMSHRSIGIFSAHLGYLLKNPQRIFLSYEKLRDFVLKHGIHPIVGKVFNLQDVAEAHRWIESRQSTGKVLLKV